MSNKKIGTEFENKVCFLLAEKGYWVHFIVPDARGAQPFDIIAVRNGRAFAIDCKTCVSNTFYANRLEENQIQAFERWLKCGNNHPVVVIEHKGKIYVIYYDFLIGAGKCKLGGKNGKDKDNVGDYVWDFDDFFNRV